MSVRESQPLVAVEAVGTDLDCRVDDLDRWRGRLVEFATVVHVPVDDDVAGDEVVAQNDVAIVQQLVAVRREALARLADQHVGLLGDVVVAHAVGDLLDRDDGLGLHLGFLARSLRLLCHVVGEGRDEDREQGQPRDAASDLLPQGASAVGRPGDRLHGESPGIPTCGGVIANA